MATTVHMGRIPAAPPGMRVRSIRYSTCPGTSLRFLVVVDNSTSIDDAGVVSDAWWVVRCDGLPDRTFRMWGGSESLSHILARYGFLDNQGCLNHKEATIEYERRDTPLPPHRLRVPPQMLQHQGVPQFKPQSGVCWFASLCWTSFASEHARAILRPYIPVDMWNACEQCLTSRGAAEELRNRMWYKYKVGDDVDLHPSNDGRNGFTEFSLLCAHLGVPMVRYRESRGKLQRMPPELHDRFGRVHRMNERVDATHFLVLRYQDGNHHTKYPIQRRILHQGRRYSLVGFYMGQRKCGHQIGAAVLPNWRWCSITDADIHKRQIGPIHVYFEGERYKDNDVWWKAWHDIVHVTKFGQDSAELCNLSPHNRSDTLLDKYRGSSTGQCSVDVMYAYTG